MKNSQKIVIILSLCLLIAAAILISTLRSKGPIIITGNNNVSSISNLEDTQDRYEDINNSNSATENNNDFSSSKNDNSNTHESQIGSGVNSSTNENQQSNSSQSKGDESGFDQSQGSNSQVTFELSDENIESIKKVYNDTNININVVTDNKDNVFNIKSLVKDNADISSVITNVQLIINEIKNVSVKSTISFENKINIYLINEFDDLQTTCQYKYINKTNYIALSTKNFDKKLFKSILVRSMSKCIVNAAKSNAFDLDLRIYNPDDFRYGSYNPQYIYNGSMSYDFCFFSKEGQLDQYTDLEDFFIEYVTNEIGVSDVSSMLPISYKMRHIKDIINKILV